MGTNVALIRRGTLADAPAIQSLQRAVAAIPGGLARTPAEITTDYVNGFVEHSLERGILVVAEFPESDRLAGELHAYRSDLELFKHVLGDLTIAVHPDAQGQGIGRRMFVELLDAVMADHPDITRVELITGESNARAQHLYESLGFRKEGRLEGRIGDGKGGVEADIPMAWWRPK